MDTLQNDTESSVRLKALLCVSTSVRNNPSNFDIFCLKSGFKVCADACKQGDQSLIRRTLFFLSALLQDMAEVPNAAQKTLEGILSNGFVELVLGALQHSEIEEEFHLEEYLGWLVALSNASSDALTVYRSDLLSIVSKIRQANPSEEIQFKLKELLVFLQ